MRTLATVIVTAACLVSSVGATRASAQSLDVTLFTGLAYPLYDERLTLTPGGPSIPGVDVTVANAPVFKADGGAVFGGSVTLAFGPVGFEGRLDTIGAAIDFSGARYDLRGRDFPFAGLTATLIADAGRFDVDRIPVMSANLRFRTPGPVGLTVSGGLSYLRDITVTGAVPLTVNAPDLPPLGFSAGLTLRATPGQSSHRIGVNGGVGVRVGGPVALVAELRGFYFKDYELRLGTSDGPALLDELLAGADAIRFEPVFVNAQVGVSFRF